jgi:hypothetical protein
MTSACLSYPALPGMTVLYSGVADVYVAATRITAASRLASSANMSARKRFLVRAVYYVVLGTYVLQHPLLRLHRCVRPFNT